MIVAFHILAHHQPELLDRIVRRLQCPEARIYIHVDKKSKDDFSCLLKKYKNLEIYSKVNVWWYGYSMVDATLFLLNKAKESGISFKYHVLLSGQDYPIRSIEDIIEFYRKESFDFVHYEKFENLGKEFFRKFEFCHFYDNPVFNPKSSWQISSRSFRVWLYYGLYVKRIAPILFDRSLPYGLIPYFGSQWFSLREESVKYIFKFLDDHPAYTKFMHFTEGPDEFFFQTILANSEVASNLTEWDEYQNWVKKNTSPYHFRRSSLRYMDWESEGREKPAILDLRDSERIFNSEYLFCRKVDFFRSKELLDQIDLNIGH